MIIERVGPEQLEELLPLVAAYQRFYEVHEPDEQRNRDFFAQFVMPNERGVVHLCRIDDRAAGFVTLYFSFSSVRAAPLAILNDLYVVPDLRGKGVARGLIEHARQHASEKNIHWMEWATAEDNERAQKLYDQLDTDRSVWLHYLMTTGD